MRKSIQITIVLTIMFLSSYGQDTLRQGPKKKHLNELGLDMTPFIKFYLNFSGNGSFNYQPNYMLTYRHYFKKGNLRSAIGGNYYYSESSSPYNGDTLNLKFFKKQSSFELRVGYEFFQNLSRRWQVYYGADLRTSYFYQKDDAPYWNGGYANGIENISKGLGLAPVLGIRFKMSRRVSLITESSFLIQYSESSTQRYYLPVTNSYPLKANDTKTKNRSFGTIFNYPISLVLTVKI